jgi:hypothetical protein
MNSLIQSNRINVTVGHQIFSIPSDKINQVINLLSTLQSIQIQENPTPYLQYNGRSLIQE